MYPIKRTFISWLLLLVSVVAIGQGKYSKVKINPPSDKRERAELLGMLEIDHFTMHEGAIIAEISQEEVAMLSRARITYEILVPDMAAHVREQNREYFAASAEQRVAMEQPGGIVNNLIARPSAFAVQPTFGGFYSFFQMDTAMTNLVALYPALAQKISLGLSVQGRNIWCIKISDNVTTDEANEPEILYIGVQHAREAVGGSSMIFLMQYLCQQYATNPGIQALVNNREIFIIPCMNPDGWEYNRADEPNGGGGWRKNRRNNGDGTFGVDLNRNWGVDWNQCGGASSSCGSPNSSSDVYWGTSAFSEPETQAIRNFTLNRHFVACIDQHSFGPYYSVPFGRPSLHEGPDTLTLTEQRYYHYIPAIIGKYNGMRAGNSIQSVGYEVAGGVKDWMLKGEIGVMNKGIVMGFTGEGGSGDGTAGPYGSFWPPASEIVSLCKGMTYQNLQIAYAAGSYVDITDRSALSVSSTTTSFPFRIRRVGLGNDPVTVTLLPIENISNVGTAFTIGSIPVYGDAVDGSVTFELPGTIQSGNRIRYAWRVETGGQTYFDTITKYYEPTILFSDNMESGAITTLWNRGSGLWNYTNSISFAGSRSLTESPGGNYGANWQDTLRCDTVFSLSGASAAYLGFWVRHRAENFRDKLQVQASANGTTWTTIAGRTTVQEPGTLDGSTINGQPSLTGIREDWIYEMYNLSAFAGQNLQFRFIFTSDDNYTGYDFQVDQGFNIDNIQLITNTPLQTLPVRFISLTGTLKSDQTILLNWEAELDADHDHFMVEESADGVSFIETGSTPGPVMYFTDRYLFPGNNYYRIRAVDRFGNSVYSSVINVFNKNSYFTMSLYPNPVRDELRMKLGTSEPGMYTILVTDVMGKTFYTGERYADNTNTESRVRVEQWPAGIYFIKILNRGDQLVGVEKFVKH